MYGAILGDIIGSPFEFDRGNKSKNFELFSPGAELTDDTVMTIAVCEGLIDVGLDCEEEKMKKYWFNIYKAGATNIPMQATAQDFAGG